MIVRAAKHECDETVSLLQTQFTLRPPGCPIARIIHLPVI